MPVPQAGPHADASAAFANPTAARAAIFVRSSFSRRCEAPYGAVAYAAPKHALCSCHTLLALQTEQSRANQFHMTSTVQTPQAFATEAFTDADAAVTRLEHIYERNTQFLRDRFEAYANGATFGVRVRAHYPFVR